MMIPDRIMRNCRCNKIAGDQGGSLVYQLIKRMLAIGTRLSPDNRTRSIGHRVSFSVHAFPVTFHIALLEIGSKPVHVLVIRKYGFGLGTIKIPIPKTHQGHDDRNILFKRVLPEMQIRFMSPFQQFFKTVVTDA